MIQPSRPSRRGCALCALLATTAGAAMAQPANDLCANATPISVPTSGTAVYGGETLSATNDGVASCGVSDTSPDVWFRYTHPAGLAAMSLNLTLAGNLTDYDTVLSVQTVCGDAGSEITCDDDSGGNLTSAVAFNVTPGSTYYIRVSGYADSTGNFSMSATLTPPPPPPALGPDVIVGDLSDGAYWGSVGGTLAYSIGTTSCNIGDVDVLWQASNNLHPVIGQNIYRIENGRMELIGQSWLKHGFTALTEDLCATCNGHGGPVLGVGCSDPYVSSLNGDQSRLGPRSHVNAATGFYPYPFATPPAPYLTPPAPTAVIGRRLQVASLDINHPNATYVGECQYTTADDATFINTATSHAQNGLNNVSYRLVTPGTNFLSMLGSTVRMQPALKAWQVLDPTVVLHNYDYQEGAASCRYWVAAKTINNNNGTWTYNYIVFNLNSDRSASSFSVPTGYSATSTYFVRTPQYHSGEFASLSASWRSALTSRDLTWATQQTYAQNIWAAALRWSTAATFSFISDSAPTTGSARLGLFKPGSTGDPSELLLDGLPVPSCRLDVDHSGTIDLFDYLDFVNSFSTGSAAADFNHDSVIDLFDYLDFVDAFSHGC